MRLRMVCALLMFLALLFSCDEAGDLTQIVLQDFTNNSGYTVYAAASSEFFLPGGPLSLDLDTVSIDDATTRDLVLLDETGASSGTYYLYAFADVNGSGLLEDGLDLMIPVLEIQLEPGGTVVLSDIVFDETSSYTVKSTVRFWVSLDYNLGLSADTEHPVYMVMQIDTLTNDLSSPKVNLNYSYARLTDVDAVRGLVAFLSANSFYMFAYYDTNNNGIADSGDYGSETDPTNVSTLIGYADDAYVSLSIENSGLIP